MGEELCDVSGSDGGTVSFQAFVTAMERAKTQNELMKAGVTSGALAAEPSRRLAIAKVLKRLGPNEWTVDQVAAWAATQGFEAAATAMVTNRITGPMLLTLTDAELRDDLGVRALGERRELLRHIRALSFANVQSRFRRAALNIKIARSECTLPSTTANSEVGTAEAVAGAAAPAAGGGDDDRRSAWAPAAAGAAAATAVAERADALQNLL